MPGGPGAAVLAATPQSSTAPHYDPSSCPWALAPTGATRPAPGDSPSLPWVTLYSTYTHCSVPAARTHTPHRVPAQRRLPHLSLPPCESGHRPRNPLPRWGHPRDSPGSGAGRVGLFGSMGAGFPCPRAPGLTPKGQLPSACGEGGRGGGATRRQRQQRKPAQRLQTGSDRTRVLRRQWRGQGRQARAAQRGTDQPRGRPPPAPSLPRPGRLTPQPLQTGATLCRVEGGGHFLPAPRGSAPAGPRGRGVPGTGRLLPWAAGPPPDSKGAIAPPRWPSLTNTLPQPSPLRTCPKPGPALGPSPQSSGVFSRQQEPPPSPGIPEEKGPRTAQLRWEEGQSLGDPQRRSGMRLLGAGREDGGEGEEPTVIGVSVPGVSSLQGPEAQFKRCLLLRALPGALRWPC